tara:strand:+ start:1619 stop:3244 length:1626 start_codon:yes stop_codon:yes gene_type:complete
MEACYCFKTQDEKVRLREALSVLSKSSPYAVSTERDESISAHLDAVKNYLYIETDIESDFKKSLTSLSPSDKKIIFLCGSSGDGKSEILTRYSKKFSTRADFHLDATHSFHPDTSAIDTLNELFESFEQNNRPLVVGINTGMLGNYSEEGTVEPIKASIKAFLGKEPHDSNHTFLDFESYPKFKLKAEGHSSEFAKALLERITANEDNIIRQFYDKEVELAKPDKRLCANYNLLSIPEVQDVIIDILFKARLMRDQFLTARALLDFIFNLLAGPNYLFDNLFLGSDNELSLKILDFDPANTRSKQLDKFILARSLGLPDKAFDDYLKFISSTLGIRRGQKPESYLRLFYILRKAQLSENYHTQFKDDFAERLIDKYSVIWNLHFKYDGDVEIKRNIRHFYRDVMIAAVHKYNNRNAPELEKGQFLISSHNQYQVASDIEISADLAAIQNHHETNASFFTAHFKIGDKEVSIPININLVGLMEKIVEGYRPNKHDKNTVVLLDELIDEIADIAADSNTLLILKGKKRMKVKSADDEFQVSGV